MNTQTIKEGVNLIDLAGRYTKLHRQSAGEWAGPCPKCEGTDRFHCKDGWFFCRQCHTERGDAIAFVRWLNGSTFSEACAILSGGALPVASGGPATPKKRGRAGDAALSPTVAQRIAKEAAAALLGSEGGPGRDYLTGRGLYPETWEAFGLGYAMAALPGTDGKQRGAAIAIPWRLQDGRTVAIRYRFLQAQTYTTDKKMRTEKVTAQFGSSFAGTLYGGHALAGPDVAETLIVCEGEVNALSIWQATCGAVGVLSLGSESAHLSEAAIRAIQQYKRVVVWVDKETVALAALAALPGAVGFKSPYGKDANDWLQAGNLAEIVCELIGRAC